MPNINPVEISNADSQTQATLNEVKDKLGMVPNLFSTFAQAPVVLNGYLQLSDSLGNGQLSARQRELIAMAVAQQNECEYCLSAHTAIGQSVGLTEQELNLARGGSAVDNVDNLIVKFAVEIVKTRGGINSEQLDALRETGINDTLIMEVIGNVALNILTNYTNRIAVTDVDFPLVRLT